MTAPARTGKRPGEQFPRAATPTGEDVRSCILGELAEVEATGADTTRRPENIGDLLDLTSIAQRAGVPPRCTATLANARRQLERGDVAACLASLREALELAR